MSESKPPSPGFDVRVDARLGPGGDATVTLEPNRAHEIVVHVPGGESPGATVPQAGVAPGGMAQPKLGHAWSTSAPTGQGSVGVAIPLPAARGVTPQLLLGYTTAGGNGPFGWGWRGPVPYVARNTTTAIVREHGRGVPEYDDANESDVLQLSGTDTLVKIGEGIDRATGAVVVRYRLRTEGSFARIERHERGGRSHFVIHDAAGVVSIFGLAPEAAVADPEDPKRVVQWLLQEQRDALGNVAVYRYQAEDDVGVDGTSGAQRNRLGPQPQRYLRRILYGNRDAAPAAPIELASLDDEAARARFMFEVVFDYGQHAAGEAAGVDDAQPWPVRADPFSHGRAGFEVRTRRLCRRVLVFHRFTQLMAEAAPVLTRIVTLGYDEDPAGSRLVSVAMTGVGEHGSLSLPARRFRYTPRTITARSTTLPPEALGGLDLSLPGIDAELFDLHADGDAGLLTREHGRFVFRPRTPPGFGDGAPIPFGATPSTDPSAHVQRWLDVGTAAPALVEFGPTDATVFARDERGAWQATQVPAGATPPVGKDAREQQHRVYLCDLDGDGIADVLVASAGSYTWWRRMGEAPGDGWQAQPAITHDGDEQRGPGPVLFDAARDLAPADAPRSEAIVIADMTGDGLPDVVRVRADEIAYWPNLGRGRFGGKVVLGKGPGRPIDERCVRACDVDGLGPASLLLLAPEGGAQLLLNEAGNRLVASVAIATPALDELALSSLGRIDGAPTGAFVWAPRAATPTVTVVELAATVPWLLVGDDNGLGARTTVRYGTAAAHARRDAQAGTPWRTRVPVGLSVVDAVVVEDLARGTRFSSSYRYAHGHWDPRERALCGFGFVEQCDSDGVTPAADGPLQTSDSTLASPPVRTRSWFFVDDGVEFGDAYDRSDPQAVILPPPDLSSLSADDRRDAARALRGVVLRTERYSDADDPAIAARPWVTTSHGWIVRSVHAKGAGHHGSVLPLLEQTLTYSDERGAQPDPRLLQTATLAFDELGFATRTATVAYPRRRAVPEPGVIPPSDPKLDPGSPGSVLLRVLDFAFDTDKSFVLPDALPGLAVLKAQCAAQTSGEVLIVGHTDRTGAPDDNLGISLQRARRVVEYLRGDVEGWLLLFDASMPASIRWGAHEQASMLAALGHDGDVAGFQARAFGSPGDGVVDDATRRALIEHYMARTGAAVPAALPLVAVGAGEGFPIEGTEATEDGVASASNRRVEALFFAAAIDPPAPAKFVAADAPQYPIWIARAAQRADVDARSGAVAVQAGGSGPVPVPARSPEADTRAPGDDPQRRTVLVVDELDLVHQQEPDVHRLGTVVERRRFEISGKPGDPSAPMSIAALRAAGSGGTTIPFEQSPSGAHERRLLARSRQYFYDDGLSQPAALGVVGKRALPCKSMAMAFTQAQAADALAPMMIASRRDDVTAVLAAGGYLLEDGGWWVPSSRPVYDEAAFFRVVAVIDPFGTTATRWSYDRDAYLVTRQIALVAGGPPQISSVAYEYRSFGARGSFDPNGSSTIRRFDALGRMLTEVRRGDPGGREHEAPRDGATLRAADHGSEGDDDDAPTLVWTYDDHAFAERGVPCSV
ncbi:MAG: hypothetical protein K1X88_35730, partial [Nannocystaceae bacterium]|nr:hypothetical protein [Nannocystaceae bacterium]